MENKARTRPDKLKQVRESLPNLSHHIYEYLSDNKVKGGSFEAATGFGKAALSRIKIAGKRNYVDTVYLFCIAFRKNFFAPILKQLYQECPECQKQDPLYKPWQEALKKIKVLEAEIGKEKKEKKK
jgi:hypothetical protein